MLSNKKIKKTPKEIIMEIKNNYSLKEDIFFPKKESPNLFIKKLEWRLNNYYDLLNNSRNLNKK